jgi:hypothetical protein
MSGPVSKMMEPVNPVLKSMILTVLIGFLVACSLEPLSEKTRVWVRIEGDVTDERMARVAVPQASASAAPTSVSAFSCLGVNVLGPGIPDTSRNPEPDQIGLFGRLLRRESYCSYRGLLVGPLSVSAGGPQEVAFTLSSGAGRLIQLVGIQEIGGSNTCTSEFNLAVPEAVGPSGTPLDSQYFELGRAVVDLFSDQVITLSTEWNGLTAAEKLTRQMDCHQPNASPTP